jgi:holo-[acyl-carrier protein] synthase
MIHGIGTDIVAVARIVEFHRKFGERALEKVLAPDERADCRSSLEPARFLAKRFAAKEAFAKALGTGVRAPALLPAIAVIHDALGKPSFEYSDTLADYMNQRGLTAHLSLSDEQDNVIAFVVVEQP